jgi:hypothetical protein
MNGYLYPLDLQWKQSSVDLAGCIVFTTSMRSSRNVIILNATIVQICIHRLLNKHHLDSIPVLLLIQAPGVPALNDCIWSSARSSQLFHKPTPAGSAQDHYDWKNSRDSGYHLSLFLITNNFVLRLEKPRQQPSLDVSDRGNYDAKPCITRY